MRIVLTRLKKLVFSLRSHACGRFEGCQRIAALPTFFLLLSLSALSGAPLHAFAEPSALGSESESSGWFDSIYLHAGMGTHWQDSDDYEGTPILAGFEAAHEDRHLVGIALFNNSFDQFSQYYYYGYKWPLRFVLESAHLKVTAGFIYGYVDEFESKLALNQSGWAPAIVPSLGWKQDRFGLDVAILGNAGLMFTFGYDVWRM